ncbi:MULTISPECIES: hypothetical protein [Microbacterium]|uniref:hypothetical protein n=1 Tax=Microbacterium TaxID=33882 RepID=UPI00278A0C34|nr:MULTISPECIES: hypothetical protein [Microbacterium]MDQ1074727.1 hypothetical protein [Microbacterium sp. SORGH_AS_0969]MDQ1114952.1 hypothetical protein [Microbacterium testaceum]
MSHDIEQHNAAPSATRRTVLAGAAWSVPVIAAASMAPLAAASDTVTLTFDKSTYNGTACSTISGAYVTATVNSVPTAGKSVTTTLSNGYKFSDGTTTNTQASGSNGRVNLPAINVPAQGGAATLTGTSGPSAATTTAAILGTANSKNYIYRQGTSRLTPAAPNGSTPLNASYFLKNGTLYHWEGGQIATNIAETSTGWTYTNGVDQIGVLTKDGKNYIYRQGTSKLTPAAPDGSTPLNASYFLKNGTLYHWSGGQIATNIAETSTGWTYTDGVDHIAVLTKDGKNYIYRQGKSRLTPAAPDGSTPLNSGYFLKNGALYHWSGGQIATNIAETSTGWTYTNGVDQIGVLTKDGKNYIYRQGTSKLTPAAPDGSTPLDGSYFLKNGTLYHWEGGQIATNIAETSTGWTYTNGVDQIGVAQPQSC